MMHGPTDIKLDNSFPSHFHSLQGISVKRLYWLYIPKTAATPTASSLRNCRLMVCGPGSSVGIATDYGRSGIEAGWGRDFPLRPDWPWGLPSLL